MTALNLPTTQPSIEAAVRDTRHWLEKAVIGLNLCPFAKAVHVKGLVHYAVSLATQPGDVLDELAAQARVLVETDPSVRETTLLIVVNCLNDFLDFNDFLTRANRVMRKDGHGGILQLASFHPDYQFAGTTPEDITNFTNRAPYPTLHLLREDSIEKAVEAFPDAAAIFETNMRTLKDLGVEGWARLAVGRAQ